jgi:hypothetical protein
MAEEEGKSRIGLMLRGQAWVELHGVFYAEELHSIAQQIEKNCKGLEKKDVFPGRHND